MNEETKKALEAEIKSAYLEIEDAKKALEAEVKSAYSTIASDVETRLRALPDLILSDEDRKDLMNFVKVLARTEALILFAKEDDRAYLEREANILRRVVRTFVARKIFVAQREATQQFVETLNTTVKSTVKNVVVAAGPILATTAVEIVKDSLR